MNTSKHAQVTEKSFNLSHVKQYTFTVRYLKDILNLYLRTRNLDPERLRVRAYADASFSTNPDHSSQLVYIVLLSDEHENSCICTMPATGVARSQDSYSALKLAFGDPFDFTYCAKKIVVYRFFIHGFQALL